MFFSSRALLAGAIFEKTMAVPADPQTFAYIAYALYIYMYACLKRDRVHVWRDINKAPGASFTFPRAANSCVAFPRVESPLHEAIIRARYMRTLPCVYYIRVTGETVYSARSKISWLYLSLKRRNYWKRESRGSLPNASLYTDREYMLYGGRRQVHLCEWCGKNCGKSHGWESKAVPFCTRQRVRRFFEAEALRAKLILSQLILYRITHALHFAESVN